MPRKKTGGRGGTVQAGAASSCIPAKGAREMCTGIPCASARGGGLDRPGALLHQEFSKESNWDDATGPDGDDQEDQTEPPSGHYHESTGPRSEEHTSELQ